MVYLHFNVLTRAYIYETNNILSSAENTIELVLISSAIFIMLTGCLSVCPSIPFRKLLRVPLTVYDILSPLFANRTGLAPIFTGLSSANDVKPGLIDVSMN